MKKGDPGYPKGRRHQDQGLEEVELDVCESQGGAQGEETGQKRVRGQERRKWLSVNHTCPAFSAMWRWLTVSFRVDLRVKR